MPARAPRRPAAPATYGLLIHGMTISGLAGASAQRHEVRHAVVVPRILLASWSGNTPPGHGCVPPNATVSGPPDFIRVRPRQRRSRLLAWSGRGRRARGNPCSRSPSLLPAAGLAEAFARNARTGSASAVADRTRMLPAADERSPGARRADEQSTQRPAECPDSGRQIRLLRPRLPQRLPTAAARPARLCDRPLLRPFPFASRVLLLTPLVGGLASRPRPAPWGSPPFENEGAWRFAGLRVEAVKARAVTRQPSHPMR